MLLIPRRRASARGLSSPTTTHYSPITLFRAAARICALVALILASIHATRAQDTVVNFDPTATQVTFTLAATLHTVHGGFKLKTGQMHFDPATGKAGGVVILDATSANTDNSSRDRKMHGEILESAKFPEISFTPTQVTGPLADLFARKSAQLQVAGIFRLHGQDHPMTIPVAVSPIATNGQFQAETKFDVPYVKWGLKNPSTFVLRVGDTVNLEIHSTVQISRPAAKN
jgi:polyisoprenoid-binding protein YceI